MGTSKHLKALDDLFSKILDSSPTMNPLSLEQATPSFSYDDEPKHTSRVKRTR